MEDVRFATRPSSHSPLNTFVRFSCLAQPFERREKTEDERPPGRDSTSFFRSPVRGVSYISGGRRSTADGIESKKESARGFFLTLPSGKPLLSQPRKIVTQKTSIERRNKPQKPRPTTDQPKAERRPTEKTAVLLRRGAGRV
ncbi:hypothetical protein MRX96_000531 [Rhipicephalus microplus]